MPDTSDRKRQKLRNFKHVTNQRMRRLLRKKTPMEPDDLAWLLGQSYAALVEDFELDQLASSSGAEPMFPPNTLEERQRLFAAANAAAGKNRLNDVENNLRSFWSI